MADERDGLTYYRIDVDGFEHFEQKVVMRVGRVGGKWVNERFDYRTDRWVDDTAYYAEVFFHGEDRYEEISRDEANELVRVGRAIARGGSGHE